MNLWDTCHAASHTTLGLLTFVAIAIQLAGCAAVPNSSPASATSERGEVHGEVALTYIVDIHGEAHNITIMHAEPPGLFDQSAIDAVKHSRFKPKYARGKLTPYRAKATYKYVLHAPPATRTDHPNSAIAVVALIKPKYPLAMRKQCLTGSVHLQFVVNIAGRARDIEIVGGKRAELFAKSARAALAGSYFMPRYVDGHPVASPAEYTYHFPERSAGDDSTGDIAAIPTLPVTPRYPTNAQLRQISGMVQLEFSIGVDGRASNVSVVSSEPKGIFDASAIDALTKSRFLPECKNGHPVAADRATFTYLFTMFN
ncbi:MAG TPA: energy transducer TonB [Gammaproteobacteria bacterium]|nr:energy transducer TonB [Gammaproteobacteria bacterium]